MHNFSLSFFLRVWNYHILPFLLQVNTWRPVSKRSGRANHNERRAVPLHHMVRPRPESNGNSRGLSVLLPGRRRVVHSGTSHRSSSQRLPDGHRVCRTTVHRLHPEQNPAGYVCRYGWRARNSQRHTRSMAHYFDIVSALSGDRNTIRQQGFKNLTQRAPAIILVTVPLKNSLLGLLCLTDSEN